MTICSHGPFSLDVDPKAWTFQEFISVRSKPATAGSKRAFHSKKTGKTWITDNCKRGKEWRATVRAAVAAQMRSSTLYEGALFLHVDFFLRRPKSHYRTGKFSHLLKNSAPRFPTKKPDTTKLLRAIEDALTDVLWVDDAQVVAQFTTKDYSDLPGADVSLYTPTQ